MTGAPRAWLGALAVCTSCAAAGAPGVQALPEVAGTPGVELTLRRATGSAARARDAVVVERRMLALVAGEQWLDLPDLGAQISHLSARSLSDPAGLVVLEQRVFPGVAGAAPPGAAPGDAIRVRTGGKILVGRVVALEAEALVVDLESGRQRVAYEAIERLDGGAAREALVPRVRLRVRAARRGRQLVELAYSLRGIGWQAEHRMTRTAGSDELTIDTWILVDNASGRGFAGASVTLIEELDPGLAHRSYALVTPLTLARAAQVRVRLGTSTRRSVSKVTRFDATGGLVAPQALELEPYFGTAPAAPRVSDELRLADATGLPSGRAQIYELPAGGGAPLLVVDSRLEAGGRDGRATVSLGPGHGLSGQRRRLALDWGPRRLVEKFEILVRNDGDGPRVVHVHELLYRAPRWRILDETVVHQRAGARTIEFPVTIGSRQRARVRYAVEYTW